MTVNTTTMDGSSDAAGDCDSTKSESSPVSSDSDSLDSEDNNLDMMSASQFLLLSKGDDPPVMDFDALETILSDDEDDNDLTPTPSVCLSSTVSSISSHSLEGSIPTITVITPDTEISYARDSYSPSLISHLLPPHFTEREFVNVLEGDALVVVDELTEYLWVVRVCRTEMVGMIPAWNVEGELERIARINMELNGRTSSPVAEFASPIGSPSSLSSECGSSGASSSTPTTPSLTSEDRPSGLEDTIEPLYVADESFYQTKRVRKVHGRRSVGFISTRPQVVFRYPSETYIHDEWDESELESHVTIATDWYCDWLEGDEDDCIPDEAAIFQAEAAVDTKRKPRRGRKRNRNRAPIEQ